MKKNWIDKLENYKVNGIVLVITILIALCFGIQVALLCEMWGI